MKKRSHQTQDIELPRDLAVQLAPQRLEALRIKYMKKNDSLAALEAFILADDLCLPFDPWVTDWIANGFRKYHANNGKVSLEQILGLREKKGRTAFQRALSKDRDAMLLRDVWILRALGEKRDTALTIAINKLKKEKDWNKTGLKLWTIRISTLRKRYREYLKEHPEFFQFYKESVSRWTRKRRDRYLESMRQYLL